ncbi:hypothetical protein PBI_SCTP2_316 [Salicola phage SCTP-2]|nr:hypothetical protein PBI_SCTP2_316 [Salicola phage SCTP-2]
MRDSNITFYKSNLYNEDFAKLDEITKCNDGNTIVARVTTRDQYVDYTIAPLIGNGINAAGVRFETSVDNPITFDYEQYEISEILIDVEHFTHPYVSVVCSKHEYHIIIINDPFHRYTDRKEVYFETKSLDI